MSRLIIKTVICWIILLVGGIACMRKEDIAKYRQRVTNTFYHGYESYLKYAFPLDELRPLTCDGVNTWGSYSLTLVDALDTLAILGNYTEFRRVAHYLIQSLNFDQDINVSVFETNIRVVGGLLSAHLLSHRAGMELEPGWPCSGPLLRLAESVAHRLLPAFETATGMPYGTVNLRHGVPIGETPVTCTSGVTTFILEFGTLSRLTGDPIFENVALKALDALWKTRSPLGLVGNHINVQTGVWTATDSGVGAGIDSYFEYLVKGAAMFQMPELAAMFEEYRTAINKHTKHDDWFFWVSMAKGQVSLPIFQSLDAFWPAILTMVGDIQQAMRSFMNFVQVMRQFGFTPEFYHVLKRDPVNQREGYPLRPELIESAWYIYRATRDPVILDVAAEMVETIEAVTRVPCGYATVKNVLTHQLDNRMESFFLAETLKYLFLLFDDDSHFIHKEDPIRIETSRGECLVQTGAYVWNTEAHLLDAAAVYCCSSEKTKQVDWLKIFEQELDLSTLWDDATTMFADFPVYDVDDRCNITHAKLTCPSQPFLQRIAIFGQVIDPDMVK